jgi:DNA repair exonuclease SbcCD nuclease subunit
MTEFTFVSTSDIHISDVNPPSRLDNFKEAIFDKISQMRVACKKLNADAALIAGDLYNIKQPMKNSHALNQQLIAEFRQFPCPIYMIEGNHDLTANRLESLKDQPLGVLFADKTLLQLRHEIIEKNGNKVSLVGVPFIDDLDLDTLVIPDKNDAKIQICLMHLYAGMKAGMMYKERLYGYDELAKFSPDIFVLGHYHVDQGIYDLNGKYFISLGSMSRGTMHEENTEHQPQLGFIRITVDDEGNVEKSLRSIKLRVKPAIEIFDMDKKAEEKKESEAIKLFVEKLATEAVAMNVQKGDVVENIIEQMNVASVIQDRVLHYIQLARSQKK